MIRLVARLSVLSVALTALLLAHSGCNTEPAFGRHADVQGPVTRADAPEGIHVPDINVADAREVDLVEQVLLHRAMYKKSLTVLRDYYIQEGYANKRQWAEHELTDFNRIKPFKYIMTAELPAQPMRPSHAITEADQLYERGRELMKKGGHGVPVFYRQDIMRQAMEAFTELVEKYPSSDKIDDAAFWLGEIHKEYFQDQERIAVQWYEKAWTWNPQTPHPARFQAAAIYDYRLHDRAKALELYRAVLDSEKENKSNYSYATKRIYELTQVQPALPVESVARRSASAAHAGEMFGTPPNTASPSPAEDARLAGEELIPVIELGDDEPQ